MKENLPYHSALARGTKLEAKPMQGRRVFPDGSICLTWNVMDGEIPADFWTCDLIYAEPAWKHGLKVFDERAGARETNYSIYCQRIRWIVQSLGLPTVMPCSRDALRYYGPADDLRSVVLHGGGAFLAAWNGAKLPDGNDTNEIIAALARSYSRVGDFACGYGTTGRIFFERGKSFVMSDYNPECCGFVCEHYGEWRRQ